MAGNQPEERVRTPIAHQSWRHVSFLHWRYEEDVIQRMLPEGLKPHLVDGSAWVGLTPFRIDGFRLAGTPALPGVSQFPETNLRTYVVDDDGVDGLWFFSLDVENVMMAVMARLGLNIPYFPAIMRLDAGETVLYESRRRGEPAAFHRIEVRPGALIGDELPERDALLIGRWRAFTMVGDHLWQVPVEHEPWPVHAATLLGLDESVISAAGLPEPRGEPVVHFSPGVDVRLGPPRRAT